MTDEKSKFDELVKPFVKILRKLTDKTKNLSTTVDEWQLSWNAVNSEGEVYDFFYDIENRHTTIEVKNTITNKEWDIFFDLEKNKVDDFREKKDL